MRVIVALPLILSALLVVSCETTDSSYGYIAHGLDEDSIVELIALSDEAVNERQYEIYEGLFAPKYYSLDRSDSFSIYQSRIGKFEYMEHVKEVFRYAKEIIVYSEIHDIEYIEPGRLALVTVQEDGLIDFQGERKRIVARVEIEVGFEDGWIYFLNATTTAKKEIKE